MRRSRRGFTLLEVLGVISIIAILATLSVIGFEQLDRSANGKQTRTVLTDCEAMLNEFENEAGAAGLSNLGAGGPVATSSTFPYPGGVYSGLTLGYNGSTTNDIEVTNVVTATTPGIATPGKTLKYGYGRDGAAVQYTWWVMANLMRIPKIKEMVSNLPAKNIMSAVNSTGQTVPWYPGFNQSSNTPPSGVTPGAGVVLLDGWGNPIIFVPAGGIYVWKKGQVGPTLITSPDGRPFFASAGPDGDFGADYYQSITSAIANTTDSWTSSTMNGSPTRTPMGDDNIYSFENGQ